MKRDLVVTIRAEITDWATPLQFRAMTDAEIIQFVREDLFSFLDGATWEIERPEREET